MQLELFVGATVLLGVLAGFIAGLLGLGGGVVLVPLFFTIFPLIGAKPPVIMHAAICTSLAVIVMSSVMAARKHYQLGNLDMKLFLSWLPAVIVGVIIGSFAINYLSTSPLKHLFMGYLLLSAIYMLFKRVQENAEEKNRPGTGAKNIGGLVVGFVATLLGIGGGTFTVPFYVAYRYPIKKAVGLSAATGAGIGLVAASFAIYHGWGLNHLPRYSLGYVNYLAVLLVIPSVTFAAPLGAKMANRLPAELLKWIYVGFLLLIVAYMRFA